MNETQMQHGYDWTGQDLTGWFMTEKLDGCRAYWDGATLWTRGGNAVRLPDDWHLPAIALDCELYDGGGNAGRARCAVALRYGKFTPTMILVAFDAPQAAGDWPERIARAEDALAGNQNACAIPWRTCTSTADALDHMTAIQALGGEGLMMRAPGQRYTPCRSTDLLKVKQNEPWRIAA
jgi:DNA ligase-1